MWLVFKNRIDKKFKTINLVRRFVHMFAHIRLNTKSVIYQIVQFIVQCY